MARKQKYLDEVMLAASEVQLMANHVDAIKDLDEAKALIAKAAFALSALMDVRNAVRIIAELEQSPKDAARFFADV